MVPAHSVVQVHLVEAKEWVASAPSVVLALLELPVVASAPLVVLALLELPVVASEEASVALVDSEASVASVVLVEDLDGRGHVTEHEPGERRVLVIPIDPPAPS